MNHQRTIPVTKSSRKSGIARAPQRKISTDYQVPNFVFQTYAEDAELEQDSSAHTQRSPACPLRDKRLLEEIYEQVASQDHLETRDLHLDVNNGVVVMKGKVSDPAMKTRIANVVRQCLSVTTIINHIVAPARKFAGERG